MRHKRGEDPQSKIFSELSSLGLNILRSPPSPFEFSEKVVAPPSVSRGRKRGQQITPAGFAYFMLGVCLALMVCGSVTFLIGLLLMPWVVGFAMVFYVVGVISSLTMLGRAIILCCSFSPPSSPQKDCSSWKLL